MDLYGPPLPPRLRDDHSMHDSDPRHVSDQHSGQSEEPSRVVSARPKKHADKRTHKVRSRYLSQSSSSEEDQSSVHIQRSSKPSRALSDQDQPRHDPDPLFYREVAMADLPSQYAEEVETLGQEALPLCSLLALTSKMPLISLSMIFWPLIYLRVNILNPLPPLQSGTRWDSIVMRTKSMS